MCSEQGPKDEPLSGANKVDTRIPKGQARHLAEWMRKHPSKRRPLNKRKPEPIRAN